MQGDATVLLVSVGQPSEGLQAELERLHVRVVPVGFTEAEDNIESDAPDLVVLSGARGATELATLLEDQEGENPLRMVIVAARKDLAKLRGLNREIVISLFALETTEKVVAQRVESLARRAARRRHPVEGAPPFSSRNSIGAPFSGAQVPISTRVVPPSAGSKDASERATSVSDTSSAAAIRPEKAALDRGPTGTLTSATLPDLLTGQDTPSARDVAPHTVKGHPDPSSRRLPRDPAKKTSLDLPAATATPRAQAAEPPRPVWTDESVSEGESPDESKRDSTELNAVVSDGDLISLRPSDFAEDDEVTKVAEIPAGAALPRFDEEVASIPPTLPPPTEESLSPARLDPSSPGEFDTSAAEAALDNLDSAKAEVTDELRAVAVHALHGRETRPSSDALPNSDEVMTRPAPDITDRETPHIPLDSAPELPPRDGLDADEGTLDEAVRLPPPAREASAFGQEVDAVAGPGGAPQERPQPGSSSQDASLSHDSVAQEGTAPDSSGPTTDKSPPSERRTGQQTGSGQQERGATHTKTTQKDGGSLEWEEDTDSRRRRSGEFVATNQPAAPPTTLVQASDSTPRALDGATAIVPGPAANRTQGPPTSQRAPGGGRVAISVLLVALGALGVAAYSGAFETKKGVQGAVDAPVHGPDANTSKTGAQGAPQALGTQAVEPTPAGQVGDGPPASLRAPPSPPEDSAPEDSAPEDSAPEDSAPEDSGAGAEVTGTNTDPFLVVDSGVRSCKDLLGAERPTPGDDPVHEASLVWNEARKMIVGGQLKEAHRKMCEAVTLNPESAAIEGLAGLYLRLGSPSQALHWLKQADRIRPNQNEMLALRGDIYSQIGRTEQARAIWLEMLAIRPEDTKRIQAVSKDYSVDAGKHLRRGDIQRADLWYRRAVILDPTNLAGVMGLAKTFYRAGKREHARAFAERALAVSDVIPEVHVLLGEISLDEGDQAQAKQRFRRALEVRPDFYPAKRGLTQVESR